MGARFCLMYPPCELDVGCLCGAENYSSIEGVLCLGVVFVHDAHFFNQEIEMLCPGFLQYWQNIYLTFYGIAVMCFEMS